MDAGLANTFVKENQQDVLELFMVYQMIEILFFMKLYPKEVLTKYDRKKAFEMLDNEINRKTLGKMSEKYREVFPQDNWKIESLLRIVTTQRNSFMHSLWMVLSAMDNIEDVRIEGKKILENYWKNAQALFDGLVEAKV